MSSNLARRCFAEAIGTFALVFAGCGAIMVDAQTQALGHLGVATVFGAVIAVMIYAVGHVSGAHFNPAVTVAFATIGKFPWRETPAYIASQIGAATLGALALRGMLGFVADVGATTPSVSLGVAFGLEVVTTFFLMFVIAAVATDKRAAQAMSGVAIGGTVLLVALFAGPLSGGSMNPARSLGPAMVVGQVSDVWLYLVAPTIGAVLGAMSYRFVSGEPVRTREASAIKSPTTAAT